VGYGILTVIAADVTPLVPPDGVHVAVIWYLPAGQAE
jgi:hypothetical protein